MTQPETPRDAGSTQCQDSPQAPQRPKEWLPGARCPQCGQGRLRSSTRRNHVTCPLCGAESPIISSA
jgi:uncharacterized protein (DUF983 family)